MTLEQAEADKSSQDRVVVKASPATAAALGSAAAVRPRLNPISLGVIHPCDAIRALWAQHQSPTLWNAPTRAVTQRAVDIYSLFDRPRTSENLNIG